MYLEGMAASSIFVHVGIIDPAGRVKYISLKIACLFFPLLNPFFLFYQTQLRPANAVHVARKHIQKAAQKHLKGSQRQPSLDSSVLSSEDGRGPYFPKDLDAMSQDSKSGDVSLWAQGAAAKAAILKGAMSEPVRRAHRVKIHEPPETRRGIFSRMSSMDSHHVTAAPCATADLHDFDTFPQASCLVDGLVPGSQNPIQEELEVELDDSAVIHGAERETGQTFEPASPEQSEGLAKEPQQNKEVASEVEPEPDTESHPQPRLPPRPQPLLAAKLLPLIPPPSPARVRRTLEAPPSPLPSTPVRTKPRSHSCPLRPTASAQTPAVSRKSVVHWEAQRAQTSGRYGSLVKAIPNGLCMPDSTSSSSSDISTDSLELMPRHCTAAADQREGTLQREMKAMFDQRMREIRCKSPLFFDDES